MKHDRMLVEIFVSKLNRKYCENFGNPIFPEDEIRSDKAVEAIYTNNHGVKLAIEHTLTESFVIEGTPTGTPVGERTEPPVGERQNAFGPFRDIFELRKDTSLPLRDYHICLLVPVKAFPKGKLDRPEIKKAVREWFLKERNHFPEGQSAHSVPGLPFDLRLTVEKTHFSGSSGHLFVGRTGAPDGTFSVAVSKALKNKVPKLLKAEADQRVLLLEQNMPYPGIVSLEKALTTQAPYYPDFHKVDEFWLVQTYAYNSEGILWFTRTWADANGQRKKMTYRERGSN